MAANSKKRKQSSTNGHPSIQLFNLRGIGDGQKDDLEGCLAEFESPGELTKEQNVSYAIPVSLPQHHSNETDLLWDPNASLSAKIIREQIQRWNAAFKLWGTTGKYEDGLLPSFDLELARHFHVQKLSKYLLDSHKEIRMPTFERWLIDTKLEERMSKISKSVPDPVLPSAVNMESEASQRMLQELTEKIPESEATRIVDELCRQTVAAVQELIGKTRQAKNQCPLRKADRVDLDMKDNALYSLKYGRKSWKKPFIIKINALRYKKVRDMFDLVHKIDISKEKPKITSAFHLILMTMLLRYASLFGGQLLNDLRGRSIQGIIPPKVFRVLEQSFGQACLECFASPFNAYYPRFGSAFSDLDWHFGSTGDFFDSTNIQGFFQANPPLSPGFMTAMVARMEFLLKEADKSKASLTFVVFVPTCNGSSDAPLVKQITSDSFQALVSLARTHLVLKSGQHFNVEGSQHIRSTRYTKSVNNTSMLLLQSKASAAVVINEDCIRDAFTSQHENEHDQRKKRRS